MTPDGARTVRRAANPWDRFYKDHVAPWRGERDLAPLRPYLGARILELGCGNGKLLKPLETEGRSPVPLDVSWHALARLGRGVLADASRLPFADSSFDTVLDIHCTGHLGPAGRGQAMTDAHRVLAPGGHLIVRRLGPGDLRASKGAVVDGDPSSRELKDGRRTHFTREDELVDAVETAGFQVLKRETVQHHPRLRSQRVTRENVQVVAHKPQESAPE